MITLTSAHDAVLALLDELEAAGCVGGATGPVR
jgi:hypothetical protein